MSATRSNSALNFPSTDGDYRRSRYCVVYAGDNRDGDLGDLSLSDDEIEIHHHHLILHHHAVASSSSKGDSDDKLQLHRRRRFHGDDGLDNDLEDDLPDRIAQLLEAARHQPRADRAFGKGDDESGDGTTSAAKQLT